MTEQAKEEKTNENELQAACDEVDAAIEQSMAEESAGGENDEQRSKGDDSKGKKDESAGGEATPDDKDGDDGDEMEPLPELQAMGNQNSTTKPAHTTRTYERVNR